MKALVVAIVCLGLAACSFSPIQAPTAPATAAATHHTPAPAPTPLGPAVPKEVGGIATIGANGPVLGVNLYSPHGMDPGQAQYDATTMISYIKNVLKARAVDIVWDLFSPGYTSDSVVSTQDTLIPASVEAVTQVALANHLMVEYRPLMFVQNASDDWEGLIRPPHPAAFFANYYAAIEPYLQLAQKYRVNEFVIGTEMDSVLGYYPQWKKLLKQAAGVYHGEISYAAHETEYFPPHTWLPHTSLTGMDFYVPSDLPSNASLGAVEAMWASRFATVPARLAQQTAIQETGIEARCGAYQSPATLGTLGTQCDSVQSNWFLAACHTVKQFHLRGLFFFKVNLADVPYSPAQSLSTFEGRPGAKAVAQCADVLGG